MHWFIVLSYHSKYYKCKKQETYRTHTEESHQNDFKECLKRTYWTSVKKNSTFYHRRKLYSITITSHACN
jgi:hypothetical protein